MLLIVLLYVTLVGSFKAPLGGIAVPGRTVPILRQFENYAAACTPNRKKNGIHQVAEIMRSLNAEEVAQKVYNSLFFSMGDANVEALLGKWYTVVDNKEVHKHECAVNYFELISKGEFTATLSILQYAMKDGKLEMNQGHGSIMGPDPGETLLNFGNTADACPYFPVKMGGLNSEGHYEYLILSQPLKYPTMVLAKDLRKFQTKYKSEVYDFVEKNGFMSPMAALNTRLHFINVTHCEDINRYYNDI